MHAGVGKCLDVETRFDVDETAAAFQLLQILIRSFAEKRLVRHRRHDGLGLGQ